MRPFRITMQTTLGSRQQRREAIVALVQARSIRRQAEFQRLLSQQGIDANQATLSRDLRDLGLVKGPKGYELPNAPAAPSAQANGTPGLQLRNAVREWLLSLAITGNLVVLRTPPSGASPLAL